MRTKTKIILLIIVIIIGMILVSTARPPKAAELGRFYQLAKLS